MYNNGFEYHALIGVGYEGTNKRPIDKACHSKEAAFRISNYCLESSIPGMYRLLAKNATTIDTYYHFNIRCPSCGCKLEPVMPAKDKHVLPMYACTCCNR